jgi:lipoprotein-anchoring transpeptidase ErfK/SrfK
VLRVTRRANQAGHDEIVQGTEELMQHASSGSTVGSVSPLRRSRFAGAVSATAGVVAALMALAACTSQSNTGSHGHAAASKGAPSASDPASSASTSAPAGPAVISTNFTAGHHVSPSSPVQVSIADGKLTDVKMVSPSGKVVTGAVSADGTSWRNNEDLGYSKTYELTATGTNADGAAVTKKTSVTTLTPNNMTMPYIQNIYGTNLTNNAKYGVGMVVRMHFDESVNRKEAQRNLKVTTSPSVVGSWYWDDDQNAYWRPKNYYTPGTKVTVAADVYGKRVGGGLYGQADQTSTFTIGPKHISIANAKTHKVKVYFDDKLQRTMPTSMGQGGTVEGKYGKIYLWTMPGTYTVLNHENPAIMSSDSYGLPSNSPLGYAKEPVYWSTKISTDGIYLHELDTTVWAQGHQNVSHGCLNLNLTNARWFYKNAAVGDVVKVVHSGGPAIQFWQGGEWSVPWATWVKGSALN